MTRIAPFAKKCLFFFSLFPFVLTAQTSPLVHFYHSNWQLVNPASVDKAFIFNEHRRFNLQGAYRQQWIGIAGSPTFSFLSLEHLPKQRKSKRNRQRVKWGTMLLRDQADALSNNGIYGNFAYLIPFDKEGEQALHIGTTTGFVWHQLAINRLNFVRPGNVIPIGSFNYLAVNIGIFYRHLRKFYIGISTPQNITLSATNNSQLENTFDGQRFYNLQLGGFIQTDRNRQKSTSDLMIEPALWIRYAPEFQFQTIFRNAPISADFNLKFHYKEHLWWGTGFGTNQLLSLEFGWNKFFGGKVLLEKSSVLKLGLNWQLPLVGFTGFAGQGIEFRLAYAWE